MSTEYIDVGALYERAKELARAAVVDGTSYGLEDVMPQERWLTVATSELISLIPVHATLNGVLDALRHQGVSGVAVERVAATPPHGTSITTEDMRVARSWLADSLAASVDEDGRQAMVDREATARQWTGEPERVTSLVLALVIIGVKAAA